MNEDALARWGAVAKKKIYCGQCRMYITTAVEKSER